MAILTDEIPLRVNPVTGTEKGPWATGFSAIDPAHVVVAVQRPDVAPLILTTGVTKTPSGADPEYLTYAVSLSALPEGWAVWPEGASVVLWRDTPKDQPYNLSPTLGISQVALKARLNALTRQSQEHRRDLRRGVNVRLGEAGVILPSVAARAGRVASYDEAGNPVAWRSADEFDNAVQQAHDDAEQVAGDKGAVEQLKADTQEFRDEANAIKGDVDALVGDLAAAVGVDTVAEAGALIVESAVAVQEAVEDFVGVPPRIEALESEQANPLTVTLETSVDRAELGATVTPLLSGTVNKVPATLDIDQGVAEVEPDTEFEVTAGAITASRTWTVTATVALGAQTITAEAEATTLFGRKRYWGVTVKAPGTFLTRAEILAAEAAGNWEWADERAMETKVFDCTGGRRTWVFQPTALGVSPNLIFDDVSPVPPVTDAYAAFGNGTFGGASPPYTGAGAADYTLYRSPVPYYANDVRMALS